MKASPNLLAATALLTATYAATAAPTVLEPNDVQIVSYASDAPDALSFVTWVDLEPGTEIRFTDRGWTCTGFQSGETELLYTAQSVVPAGSVFEFVNDPAVTPQGSGLQWEILSGSFSLSSNPGDQVIVYQGTAADPTPIYAFDTTDGWEDCASVTDAYASALPAGLVDGVSAVTFAHSDSFWYRPWYAKSATLPTLKEWMVNRNRFKTTSTSATRLSDYEAPTSGFTIRTGQRGSNGYTEYIPGTAACIILTGHDGDVYPPDIVDRAHGCWTGSECDWTKTCAPQDTDKCRAVTANDENTQDMARRANDYLETYAEGAGGTSSCHLIVNRLARIKLDPNRELGQAAQFDQTAIDTYDDFHAFVTAARMDIQDNHPCGAGLLIDFHGHVHPEGRIEVGYKLNAGQLRESDGSVDGLDGTSSIKNMPTHNSELLSELIRGSTSIGGLFELPTADNATGYLSVPSPLVNAPAEGESYFEGGYNILTHGSQNGGSIDAVQIEFPRYLRAQEFGMQEDMLRAFAEVVVPTMLSSHYPAACDLLFAPTTPSPVSPTGSPTASPTSAPTTNPTDSPTRSPTASPTSAPTTSPTDSPTGLPTTSPTSAPTVSPTDSPTGSPTASPTSAPTPAKDLVAYDMVNSASQGLTSYTNAFTGAFTSSWDSFQKHQRGSGSIPPYLRDDGNDPSMASVVMDGSDSGLCCGFFYKYGIVDYSDEEEFFGVVDTDGENTQSVDVGTATWQFDVAGRANLDVSIDMAAIGDFESTDYFKWTASIDGGNSVVLYESTVDTSSSHVYTLSDGTTKTFDDPIKVDGIVLENRFNTFTKSLASLNLTPLTGSTVTLQLEAKVNSSFEVFAFRSIKILGSAPTCAISDSECTSSSQCCSGKCKGNDKCQ